MGCVPHTLGGVLNMCVPPLPRASSWCLSYLEVREDRHDLNRGDARLAVVLRDLRAGHRRVSRLCVFPQNPGETPRYPGGGQKKTPPPHRFLGILKRLLDGSNLAITIFVYLFLCELLLH